MTLKKIERSQRFLKKHLTLFRCPICHLPYQAVQSDSLVCPQGHRLDLNRQGTLYFLRHQVHRYHVTESAPYFTVRFI